MSTSREIYDALCEDLRVKRAAFEADQTKETEEAMKRAALAVLFEYRTLVTQRRK